MATAFADISANVLYNLHGKKQRSGATHQTGALVWRDSREEGTFEHHFFRQYAKGEPDQLLKALDKVIQRLWNVRVDDRRYGTNKADQLPTLTNACYRIYRYLTSVGRTCKGEIRPGYEQIASQTSLARATVARSLRQLEKAGFLVKQRRFKRVEKNGPGPRWIQTSNAYRLAWPEALKNWLSPNQSAVPTPDDDSHRREEDAKHWQHIERSNRHKKARWRSKTEAMYRRLPIEDRKELDKADDADLHVALLRLQYGMTERGSHKDIEPPHILLSSYVEGSKGVGLNGQRSDFEDDDSG